MPSRTIWICALCGAEWERINGATDDSQWLWDVEMQLIYGKPGYGQVVYKQPRQEDICAACRDEFRRVGEVAAELWDATVAKRRGICGGREE